MEETEEEVVREEAEGHQLDVLHLWDNVMGVLAGLMMTLMVSRWALLGEQITLTRMMFTR